MESLNSFEHLKNGTKIISPIDKEVTEIYVDINGMKYLSSKKCLFPCFQFEPSDFYLYYGNKEVGELDYSYFEK